MKSTTGAIGNPKHMKFPVTLAPVVMMLLSAAQMTSAAGKSQGAVDLFDGKSLRGWEHYLVEPDVAMADVWGVQDGVLVCKGKPMGYLATKDSFTDFRLVVEWRWPPGKPAGNSGVLLRITGEPKALPKCVEAQLQHGSAGDVYGFHGFNVKGEAARTISAENAMFGKLSGVSKIKGNENEPGQWNRYDITLKGGDLTVFVNGEKVNEATGLDLMPGKIGLQSEGAEIHFRAVRLTPLSLSHAIGTRSSEAKSSYTSAADRAKPLLEAEFIFRPSVFYEIEAEGGRGQNRDQRKRFPSCDFAKPDQARQWLGDYDIDVTFYNKDHEVVDEPTDAGRYGAVVKIKAEDGHVYTRFRTLYKTPSRQRLRGYQIQGDVALPKGYGVAERTWHNQRESVNDYLASAVQRDVERSHDLAVLLAGLNEMSPKQGSVSQLESALTVDRQWWLTLKRKLNGNAERFAHDMPTPTAVDGVAAPVLRVGTEEEAGMKAGTVEKIHAVLEEWVNNSDQPFNVCVARHGVVFFSRAYGSRNGAPVTTETKHIVYSITKALSGSLLMMFVDRDIVQLNDPVGNILPEFRDGDVETPVTYHHLFTHTADMDGHFTDLWNDLEHVYGEAYPYLRIGGQHRYNGTSIGIGLKALEQLTGLALPRLYQTYLFGPLGCESIESIDGSALTWSNAYDLARVGQMLANHGTYGNLRFFREETFQQMLPRKLDSLLGPETDVTWGIGLTWFRGNGLSQNTIGHGSASSCTFRIDLEKDLVITMTRETAGNNFGKYHPRFIAAITSGAAD